MTQRAGISLLTSLTILALTAAANGAPQAGKAARETDPDVVEIRQYRLTMDKVERLAASYQDFFKLMEAHPEFRKGSDDSKTLDQKVKTFEQYPQVTALIHGHGFSTREYLVASVAFISDLMVVGMKKQGSIKEYPADAITPENAAFVEQNYDKLNALYKKMSPPQKDDKDEGK
jgi:hypothetical protein